MIPFAKILTLAALTICGGAQAQSVIAFDKHDSTIIASEDAARSRPAASLTKLMLALVTLDRITPTCTAVSTPEDRDTLKNTRTILTEGIPYSCSDLLSATIIKSDNQAAHALARTVFGSKSEAVAQMNAKAVDLGLRETHFADPSGLSPSNLTSARDMLVIALAASEKAQVAQLSIQGSLAMEGQPQTILHNTNLLVRKQLAETILSKTGFTNEAGRNLAYIAKSPISGHEIAVIVLGASQRLQREEIALKYIGVGAQVLEKFRVAIKVKHPKLRGLATRTLAKMKKKNA